MHEEDANKGVDRGFFKHFVIVGYVCRVFGGKVAVRACAGYVVFFALDRHGCFVVGMMGRSPCIEGTEDELGKALGTGRRPSWGGGGLTV